MRNSKKDVLFVNDDPLICELYKDLLEFSGHTVTVANLGKSALEIFQAKPNNFDLVITDQGMPNMDGKHLAQ